MWQDELVRFTLVSDVDRVDIYSPQYLVASSWWIHIWCACVWHFNIRSGFLKARAVEGRACVLDSKTSENDGCGVRTHALSDWRLKPAP